MAAIKLIRAFKPSPSPAISAASTSQTTVVSVKVKCMTNAIGFNLENNRFVGDGDRKPTVIAKAAVVVNSVVAAPAQTNQGVDVATLVTIVRTAMVRRVLLVIRSRSRMSIVQSFIEKAIIDCRFFTMFAVAGTLLGSVLCFLEGTNLVMESYIHSLSHHSDHVQTTHLLIESLDMFLVGTAMLVYGMGLHVMFIKSQDSKAELPSSNLFGTFSLKKIPTWAGMKSVTQAKSMIGYALMLLLQVGVLEKFKSIPLVTGFDLACFAGSVFVSSVSLFILSRLNLDT